MKKLLIAAAAVIGCALVFAGSVDLNRGSGRAGISLPIEVSLNEAYAGRGYVRRTSRRTARRTTRRVIRRSTLPAGCVWRAPYHYCGGVYYEPIVESGGTVYVVVNP